MYWDMASSLSRSGEDNRGVVLKDYRSLSLSLMDGSCTSSEDDTKEVAIDAEEELPLLQRKITQKREGIKDL